MVLVLSKATSQNDCEAYFLPTSLLAPGSWAGIMSASFLFIPGTPFPLRHRPPCSKAHLSEPFRGRRKVGASLFRAQILRENSSNSPRTWSSHSTATAWSTGM